MFKDYGMIENAGGKRVAIIIGHSREMQGASNQDSGITEFKFNEPLAHEVSKALVNLGYHTNIIYRNCTYAELPGVVNKTNADIAISLHCNAFNKSASGSEVLHYANSVEGKKLAAYIQHEIINCLQLNDRGLKPCVASHLGKAGDRGGHLLKYTRMPCVITEPFFIDSNSDLERAKKRFDGLVDAYVTGIVKYFNKGK